MARELIRSSATIVLVGQFNPSAFVLQKIGASKLLSSGDLQASQYEQLLQQQITVIRVASWGLLTVQAEQFVFEVSEPPFVRASDFVLRCLRELAPDSRVRMLGLNASADYRFIDPALRDQLGRRLVPANSWGDWGRALASRMDEVPAHHAGHPGLISATFREPMPRGRDHGYRDIKIEALRRVADTEFWGVRFTSNDHFEPAQSAHWEGSSESVITATLLDAVEGDFETSIDDALMVFEDILNDGSK